MAVVFAQVGFEVIAKPRYQSMSVSLLLGIGIPRDVLFVGVFDLVYVETLCRAIVYCGFVVECSHSSSPSRYS
jgi:hypothetical protein